MPELLSKANMDIEIIKEVSGSIYNEKCSNKI